VVTITKPVVVFPLPLPQFNVPDVCHGRMSNFVNTTIVPAPDYAASYQWKIFESTSPVIYNNQNAQHLFPAPGNYTARLIVATNNNCKDSTDRQLRINPNPVADFSISEKDGCSPHCTTFDNKSTIASGFASYIWDFGNGQTFIGPNPTVTCFLSNSNMDSKAYTLTLTATSDFGCITNLVKKDSIIVFPMPIADFTTQPDTAFITTPLVNFNNTSIGSTAWYWTFGDLSYSIEESLEHRYFDTGVFEVKLLVSNGYGCLDSIYRNVVIREDFTLYIPNAFTPNGDLTNDWFFPVGEGILDMEITIFNRWGEKIYSGTGIKSMWDGKFQGQPVPMGVYSYVINIHHVMQEKNAKPVKYVGQVTVLR
jgi:gliding motility-associated-like protein